MERVDLLDVLERLDLKTDEQWLSGLDGRKLEELRFHDRNRDMKLKADLPKDTYEALYGNKKFYRTVKLSSRYVNDWIAGNSPGRTFLDYACGNGLNAITAAKAGASLAIGLDISRTSVMNARGAASAQGVSGNTFFVQGDCENTGLPDCCIDVAICSGMLHHLDLSHAFCELRRILKPGGRILVIEALDYNPAIKLYRNLTPRMRTDWEKKHILSLKDLDFASRFFDVRQVRYWHLFSIAGVLAPGALPLLDLLDRFALKLPLVRLMAWMFSFELHKKAAPA